MEYVVCLHVVGNLEGQKRGGFSGAFEDALGGGKECRKGGERGKYFPDQERSS